MKPLEDQKKSNYYEIEQFKRLKHPYIFFLSFLPSSFLVKSIDLYVIILRMMIIVMMLCILMMYHHIVQVSAKDNIPTHNTRHESFLNSPFSLLDSDTWSMPKELSSQLADLKAPIFPVMLMGVSRSGKSLLLNLFARYLLENNLASSPIESKFFEPHSLHSFPFGVSSDMTRCSVGIHAIILKRIVSDVSEDNSGYYFLMDAEGSDNGNRKIVSKILGIGRHLTNCLIFVDDNRFDRALDALGRLVAYGLKSSQAKVSSSIADGSVITQQQQQQQQHHQSWPRLVMVLNKVLETLPANDMKFFREQIRNKEDDDDATNGLRTLISELFGDLEFITVPHNQTIKHLIETEGASSLAQLQQQAVGGAAPVLVPAPSFIGKFHVFAEHLVNTVSPLVLYRHHQDQEDQEQQPLPIASTTASVTVSVTGTAAIPNPPQPEQLLVNGKMFAAHLASLLEKSKEVFFPDANYLQQIVSVACEEIKESYFKAYQTMLEEQGLIKGQRVSGSQSNGGYTLSRFNHTRQIEEVHAQGVKGLLQQLEVDISDYRGGCNDQKNALLMYYQQHLLSLCAVLDPVGHRQEMRRSLLSSRIEQSVASIANAPNTYFSGRSLTTSASAVRDATDGVSTGSSGSSGTVAEVFFARSLDTLLPSTHCNISITALEYSTMQVSVREITILGNGVELPQPWKSLEAPEVVISSKQYSYKHFTTQWAFLRLVLCAVVWYSVTKLYLFVTAVISVAVEFVPMSTLTEVYTTAITEFPVCMPLCTALKSIAVSVNSNVQYFSTRMRYIQSLPCLALLLFMLFTYDSLCGKYHKYLAYSQLLSEERRLSQTQSPVSLLLVTLQQSQQQSQQPGFLGALFELYTAVNAVLPSLFSSMMEKLSRMQWTTSSSSMLLWLKPEDLDTLLQLSFTLLSMTLALLAITAAVLLGISVTVQLLRQVWVCFNSNQLNLLSLQEEKLDNVLVATTTTTTTTTSTAADSTSTTALSSLHDNTTNSATRTPVTSVSFHMTGLHVSPTTMANTDSSFSSSSLSSGSTGSLRQYIAPGSSGGRSDMSLHSVDSQGSPLPLHQLLLQIQQHSVVKKRERGNNTAAETATPSEKELEASRAATSITAGADASTGTGTGTGGASTAVLRLSAGRGIPLPVNRRRSTGSSRLNQQQSPIFLQLTRQPSVHQQYHQHEHEQNQQQQQQHQVYIRPDEETAAAVDTVQSRQNQTRGNNNNSSNSNNIWSNKENQNLSQSYQQQQQQQQHTSPLLANIISHSSRGRIGSYNNSSSSCTSSSGGSSCSSIRSQIDTAMSSSSATTGTTNTGTSCALFSSPPPAAASITTTPRQRQALVDTSINIPRVSSGSSSSSSSSSSGGDGLKKTNNYNNNYKQNTTKILRSLLGEL